MWALGAGRSGSYLDGNNPLPFIASIFGAILLSYLMSWLFLVLVIDDWQRGLFVGLIIGCGFIAPMIVMHYMFLGLPYNVIMIDSVKDIVGAGFTGLLLATWRADRSDELVG